MFDDFGMAIDGGPFIGWQRDVARPPLFKGGRRERESADRRHNESMALQREQGAAQLAIAQRQLELASEPIPIPKIELPAPAVTATTADVENAKLLAQRRLRAKSGNNTIRAGYGLGTRRTKLGTNNATQATASA